jgi:hypothetical protein
VRAANGIDVFQSFLDSYTEHPAGESHRLVLLFKGFPSEFVARPYFELAAGLEPEAVFVDDEGLDLHAYLTAARELEGATCCFLNSYSRLLAGDWLAKLAAALADGDAGMVGVAGSYESTYSSAPLVLRPRLCREFPRFPNPHLRTNGFMIERELMLELDCVLPRSKRETLALESGRRSLSREVWARGLEVLVVGADGVAYAPARWRESATFRSGGQRNLLIADNRTRQYEEADPALRTRLEKMAWGDGHVSLPDWVAPARRATPR